MQLSYSNLLLYSLNIVLAIKRLHNLIDPGKIHGL